MLTQTIRRNFLRYFQSKGHTLVPSSPVIPFDDPTLLFVNAGMNQFKDVFLGKSSRDYTRATSSQKCIRVGGKHNDLENVGHTSRHLTFFEMLGNFSFGDYFKEQAIQYAWEVATTVFGFDEAQIWPSVFREDDEAFELWTRYVPAERITRLDEKDNFWAMGESGPCGPCSELYFDRGIAYGQARNPREDTAGNRFLEFWNLVFMQYNTHPSGQRELLPKPSIDTGAGLERVAALKLGVDSVFETDVLRRIISEVESIAKTPYQTADAKSAAFRVIADHLRCLSFSIADGVQPSNIDRGYVLRKVLRRAVRYGRTLGIERPFLADLLPALIETMGADYPELIQSKERIAEIVTLEEENFIRTLKRGGTLFNQVIEKAKKSHGQISGEDAFTLKDTYGLPFEEISLMAKDLNLQIDTPAFEELEIQAKERSKSAHKKTHQIAENNLFAAFIQEKGETLFCGYEKTEAVAEVVGLMVGGSFVSTMQAQDEGLLFLRETPFYAEMGGQVGDRGEIRGKNGLFCVEDCKAPYKGLIAHIGSLKSGSLSVGETVTAVIDTKRRKKIANNHTATHLLHFALHQILGEHIKQAGSVVDEERLRFDFNHHKSLSAEEIRAIEDCINTKIRENSPVNCYEVSFEEAQKRSDIKQFFGEKYGATVRVVDIDYSKELCGGTHAPAVGQIGLFKIVKEGSIAAGVRRIEAVVGSEAESFCRESENKLQALAQLLKSPLEQLQARVEKLLEENKKITQELKAHRQEELQRIAKSLISQKIATANGSWLIAAEISLSPEEARECLDLTAEKLGSGIVVLAAASADKGHIWIKVSADLVAQGKSAHELVKKILPLIEGNGGGKALFAQGAGKAPQKLIEALELIKTQLAPEILA